MSPIEQLRKDNRETSDESFLETSERLKIINDLCVAKSGFRHEYPDESGKEHWYRRLELRESNPSRDAVTLGIEIEIPEESVLPPESKKWKQSKKEIYLMGLRNQYKETERIGVPKGDDQLWEFAHLPAHEPETLVREVQALIKLEMINRDYHKFPLHVTVGGISFLPGETDSSTHLLARVLDATGWETSGERLLAPYVDDYSNWTHHDSFSGIRNREAEKIIQPKETGMKHSVELRTPELRSLSGLARYLESVYYLGSALRAYQENKKDNPVNVELAQIWQDFTQECSKSFIRKGLSDPSELWFLYQKKPEEPSPFKELARVLNSSVSDKEGKDAAFVHEIRLLVIQTRNKIREILDKTKNVP